MATMTIKNMPDDLYAALKETAAANRRSLNSWCKREYFAIARTPPLF